MKALIVGSNGFLGSRLLPHLRQSGLDMYGASSSIPGGMDPRTGVLSESFAIPRGTKVVVYLAASPFHRAPERVLHVLTANMMSAISAAELARQAGVARFVYASTGNVYASSFRPLSENNPLRRDNWYVISKVHAEEALALYRRDMEVILARPFGVYGPGQKGRLVPSVIEAIASGSPIRIYRNPENTQDTDGLRISLCYVDDAVRIFERLVLHGGPPCINVAGDIAVSIRELANTVSEAMDVTVKFEILDQYRDTDLIADTVLLKKALDPRFTDLSFGIRDTIGSMPNVRNV